MEFVYLYRDLNDGKYKYIGRSKNEGRLYRRLQDHGRESWYGTSDRWEISVIGCINRAASEATETELINRYDPEYNRDKKGWGPIGLETPEPVVLDWKMMRVLEFRSSTLGRNE